MMYIRIMIITAILTAAAGGYWYINKLQSDLETARENVAKMETAVKLSEDSLRLMETETKRLNEMNLQLSADLQKAEQYGDELRNTLQKHNLTQLALKKPGLIEKRMQNATDELWNDLADITDPNGVQQLPDTGTKDSNSN